jgi:hypothetical protein
MTYYRCKQHFRETYREYVKKLQRSLDEEDSPASRFRHACVRAWWRRVNFCRESNSTHPGYYFTEILWKSLRNRIFPQRKNMLGIPTVCSRNEWTPRFKNDDIKLTTYVLQYDVMNQGIAHVVRSTSWIEAFKLVGKRIFSIYGDSDCRNKLCGSLMK